MRICTWQTSLRGKSRRYAIELGSMLVGITLFIHGLAPSTAAAADPPRTIAAVPGAVPSDELRSRRSALAEGAKSGVILIEARGDEENAATREFFYTTGLDAAGSILLLVCEEGLATETLFLPARSTSWELWNGPRPFPGPEASKVTGIGEVLSLEVFPARFEEALANATALWHLPTAALRPEVESADSAWRKLLRARHPQLETIETVGQLLDPLRQVKGADEVTRLRRAIAITSEAFKAAFATARPGGTEFEIEAAIEGTFRRFGGEGPGFASIVGAGAHSCVLHYQQNQGPVASGDLVVIDVGASWGHYTADITRTIPASGRYTERQREIYQIVARAQEAGIRAARPGATIRDVHRAARAVFEAEGLERYFPHGTSHHVGLEVHDVGSTRRPLAEGMVITVEPGLYLADESLGIRIEDMVLITENGCVILTDAIPRTPDDLEEAIERARSEVGVDSRLPAARGQAM